MTNTISSYVNLFKEGEEEEEQVGGEFTKEIFTGGKRKNWQGKNVKGLSECGSYIQK